MVKKRGIKTYCQHLLEIKVEQLFQIYIPNWVVKCIFNCEKIQYEKFYFTYNSNFF